MAYLNTSAAAALDYQEVLQSSKRDCIRRVARRETDPVPAIFGVHMLLTTVLEDAFAYLMVGEEDEAATVATVRARSVEKLVPDHTTLLSRVLLERGVIGFPQDWRSVLRQFASSMYFDMIWIGVMPADESKPFAETVHLIIEPDRKVECVLMLVFPLKVYPRSYDTSFGAWKSTVVGTVTYQHVHITTLRIEHQGVSTMSAQNTSIQIKYEDGFTITLQIDLTTRNRDSALLLASQSESPRPTLPTCSMDTLLFFMFRGDLFWTKYVFDSFRRVYESARRTEWDLEYLKHAALLLNSRLATLLYAKSREIAFPTALFDNTASLKSWEEGRRCITAVVTRALSDDTEEVTRVHVIEKLCIVFQRYCHEAWRTGEPLFAADIVMDVTWRGDAENVATLRAKAAFTQELARSVTYHVTPRHEKTVLWLLQQHEAFASKPDDGLQWETECKVVFGFLNAFLQTNKPALKMAAFMAGGSTTLTTDLNSFLFLIDTLQTFAPSGTRTRDATFAYLVKNPTPQRATLAEFMEHLPILSGNDIPSFPGNNAIRLAVNSMIREKLSFREALHATSLRSNSTAFEKVFWCMYRACCECSSHPEVYEYGIVEMGSIYGKALKTHAPLFGSDASHRNAIKTAVKRLLNRESRETTSPPFTVINPLSASVRSDGEMPPWYFSWRADVEHNRILVQMRSWELFFHDFKALFEAIARLALPKSERDPGHVQDELSVHRISKRYCLYEILPRIHARRPAHAHDDVFTVPWYSVAEIESEAR